ncbi:MAG: hypothetical protein H6978_06815 [Gammaproteobacteria bacterium]|nr:hypothetical protein [Gammaproteobacteria bacterium]
MKVTRRKLVMSTAAAISAAVWRPRFSVAQSASAAMTERVHHDLQTHAGFGLKHSGGDGDNATAGWVANRLRSAGYNVQVSTFDAPYYLQRAAFVASGDNRAAVLAQAPVIPTGAAGISAPLALVEAMDGPAPATIGDLRGRIALVQAPFGRHAALSPTRGFGASVLAAADAGAVAVIIITTGPTGEAIALNCPETPFVDVPVAILAPKDAAPFVAAARAGDIATLVTDGDPLTKPCMNVVARLERGPEWIAISTPRSGWFHCVAERGTGTAAFLEIADWARDRFPDKSIFLMNTGGHEYYFAGSHHALHEAPSPAATRAWMHIGATLAARDAEERNGEWVMLDTADPQRRVMASKDAAAAAEQGFHGLSGMSPPGLVQPQAGELSAFTDLGYTNAFAAIGVHRWFHTLGDTLDCVDARLVVPVIEAHQRTLELILG